MMRMDLRFINYCRHAPFIGIVIVLLLTGCNRISLKDFNVSDKKEITKNVVLHRTSGSDVTLTDADGVGLVYGNVKRIGFEADRKDYLLVAFESFSDSSANSALPTLEVSRIELSSGKAASISDRDGSIAKSLQTVDSFF